MKWFFLGLVLVLSACSKPRELEAPCHNFGKYCSQLPINESPIQEYPQ